MLVNIPYMEHMGEDINDKLCENMWKGRSLEIIPLISKDGHSTLGFKGFNSPNMINQWENYYWINRYDHVFSFHRENGSTLWYHLYTYIDIDTCVYIDINMNMIHIYIQLVGGLKHFLFSIIYGIILPIDFHICSRWLWHHQPDQHLCSLWVIKPLLNHY